MIATVDPRTNEVVATFEEQSAVAVEEMIDEAAAAQVAWRRTSVGERAACVDALGDILLTRRQELATLITLEMGKPITQAETEIDKCIESCRFLARHAVDFLSPTPVDSTFDEAFIRYDPLGVVLGIMPWNFPFWQVLRFALPAFLAGNTVLLRHASNVPQCALAIGQVVDQAGFPRGQLQTLLVSTTAIAGLIADPRVAAVCITGSSEVGANVAATAGAHLKKHVLELGGSDAFLVLEDANVDLAVSQGTTSRMNNCGQTCVAAKRFVVHESLAEVFAQQLAKAMSTLVVGDPRHRDTEVGPLAREDLVRTLARQVDASVALGARVLVGGLPGDPGPNYYRPTVLVDVLPDMPVFAEETFGPVAPVVAFKDEDQAVDMINASEYGLGASIWTRNIDRARELAARIDTGSVFVNSRVASNPALPFGGVKRSGYGREMGMVGLRELTNVKAVAVRVPSS